MNERVNVFVGYDSRETVAYHVLCNSIIRRSSRPISFTPIVLEHMQSFFDRVRDPLQSTDFSFSRFLVPYLCQFQGWGLFMDCDVICRADIGELWDLRDDRYAVQVIKHDYNPSSKRKMFDQVQSAYPKKNWSSVVLFNNQRCKSLSLDYVNSASGLELHQFKWLENEMLIGSLPIEWNFLVGEYRPEAAEPKLLHYTLGGPYIPEYAQTNFADEWFSEFEQATSCDGKQVTTKAKSQ